MVFKRRDKRTILQSIADFFYPKGGWTRAFHYVKHRLRRLPDPPHKIARGLFAGVLVSFTPFFGLHFIAAAVMARALRGNIMAGLLGTFFGNPLTFPFIAPSALQTGYMLLGKPPETVHDPRLLGKFSGAGGELFHNIGALFTNADADWTRLHEFFWTLFYPYLIGGLIPGVIAGLAVYYVSVPVISVYQKRRRGRLKKKLAELRAKSAKKADEANSKS